MTIQDMIDKLRTISKDHDLGLNAPMHFTIQADDSPDSAYECLRFLDIYLAEASGPEDLVYLDFEPDGWNLGPEDTVDDFEAREKRVSDTLSPTINNYYIQLNELG